RRSQVLHLACVRRRQRPASDVASPRIIVTPTPGLSWPNVQHWPRSGTGFVPLPIISQVPTPRRITGDVFLGIHRTFVRARRKSFSILAAGAFGEFGAGSVLQP